MHKLSGFKRGDTLIEVMLSVAIFGMVTVGSIQLMNRGVATAQGNLETSMARNEIDAQAEALRFIHKAYTTNRSNNSNPYTILWGQITTRAVSFNDLPDDFFSSYNGGSCTNNSGGYSDSIIMNGKSFIINPRYFNNLPTHKNDYTTQTGTNVLSIYNATGGNLTPAETYPRLIYTDESTNPLSDQAIANEKNQRFATAEGIWVTAVKQETALGVPPNYYDFYIRTCWSNISGHGSTTISSIVRLYNPDIAPAAEIAGGGSPVTPVDPGGGGGGNYDPSPDPVTPSPENSDPDDFCLAGKCYDPDGLFIGVQVHYTTSRGYAGAPADDTFPLAIQMRNDAMGRNDMGGGINHDVCYPLREHNPSLAQFAFNINTPDNSASCDKATLAAQYNKNAYVSTESVPGSSETIYHYNANFMFEVTNDIYYSAETPDMEHYNYAIEHNLDVNDSTMGTFEIWFLDVDPSHTAFYHPGDARVTYALYRRTGGSYTKISSTERNFHFYMQSCSTTSPMPFEEIIYFQFGIHHFSSENVTRRVIRVMQGNGKTACTHGGGVTPPIWL